MSDFSYQIDEMLADQQALATRLDGRQHAASENWPERHRVIERQSNDRTASVNYRLLCMAVVGLGLSGRRSPHAAGRATQAQNRLHPDPDAGCVRW